VIISKAELISPKTIMNFRISLMFQRWGCVRRLGSKRNADSNLRSRSGGGWYVFALGVALLGQTVAPQRV